MSNKLHIGIFGPTLSGKTTIAKHISQKLADEHKIPSIVLDPIEQGDWGDHAVVFSFGQEEKFWQYVWTHSRSAVFVDEATETINRDKDLIPAFTRIRHRQHKLFVVGHRGNVLLPIMRDQIGTLYLFRQNEDAAKLWSDQFTDKRILIATDLNEFEFLFCELYGNVIRMKYDPQKKQIIILEKYAKPESRAIPKLDTEK